MKDGDVTSRIHSMKVQCGRLPNTIQFLGESVKDIVVEAKSIDQEWVRLILEAKTLGLTKEEIRAFLKNPKGL
ncbi:anti-repressor SinI family protein [Bacillus sp. N9]